MKPSRRNLRLTVVSVGDGTIRVKHCGDLTFTVVVGQNASLVLGWTFLVPARFGDIQVVEIRVFDPGDPVTRLWPGNGNVLKATQLGHSPATADSPAKTWLWLELDPKHLPLVSTTYPYEIVLSDASRGKPMRILDVDPSMTLEPDGIAPYRRRPGTDHRATKGHPMQTVLEFEAGWTITWLATTQASFEICLTMKDPTSGHVYVDHVCRSSPTLGVLSHGTARLVGDLVEVEIVSSGGHAIQWREAPLSVAPDSTLIARGYLCIADDYVDNDLNDLCLSIMGWERRP